MTVSELVSRSHVVATRVEVVSGSSVLAEIYPVDGAVQVDAGRAIRRTCSLRFVDYDGTLVPLSAGDLLAPGVNELVVYRGVETTAGAVLERLGTFVIAEVSVDASESGVEITVVGEDRARLFTDKRWRKPKKITSGATIATVIEELATDAQMMPSLTVSVAASATQVVPSSHALTIGAGNEQNPWTDLTTIAQAAGLEIYFDVDGVLVAEPHPAGWQSTTRSQAVRVFEAGAESTLLGTSRALSSSGITNGIRVVGEGSGTATDGGNVPSGEALDQEPSSPTNVTALGERVTEISSPLARNNSQCQTMADLLLPAYVGWPVDLSVICDPSLDVRDVIWVYDPRIGVDSPVVIDALDIPLAAGSSMSITGRIGVS